MIVRAPGRVNILGEHVDYNDGIVMPAAINRAVYLAVALQPETSARLLALDLNQETSFDLDRLADRRSCDGAPLPGWAAYPAGVAWALQASGLSTPGVLAAYSADIPIGAGLSSSAAVEVGFAAGWQALGGWQVDRLQLAQLCQRAENAYVGVASGLMDQFASACGVEGHVLYFDTRSLDWQPAPIPEQVGIVIADSGVRRSLTHSGYNQRRSACEAAVQALQAYIPGLRSLRDLSSTEFAAYGDLIPEIPRKRAEHVVKEIARVQSALHALQRQDLRAFGALMYSSHNSLRFLYEVSTPELDRSGRTRPGIARLHRCEVDRRRIWRLHRQFGGPRSGRDLHPRSPGRLSRGDRTDRAGLPVPRISRCADFVIVQWMTDGSNMSGYHFNWDQLGDITLGRPNLGSQTQVAVYRLMQYTMRAVLEKELGEERMRAMFVAAGELAGIEFCRNMLDITLPLNKFLAQLHEKLIGLSIGVLKVEKADSEALNFVVTVSEDLDCSGLPLQGVTVCDYDEGFIAGIFHVYTQKDFTVKEIDCWSTGERTCRFSIQLK